MSDLPGWAKGEGEAAAPSLGDKLVDEAAGVKPEESASAAAAAADTSVAGSEHGHEEKGPSHVLCFFRFLQVLTVLLALVVIGTNCYIIYDQYAKIKGELEKRKEEWRGRRGGGRPAAIFCQSIGAPPDVHLRLLLLLLPSRLVVLLYRLNPHLKSLHYFF